MFKSPFTTTRKAFKRGRIENRRFFSPPKTYRADHLDASLSTALVVGNGPSLASCRPSDFPVNEVFLCNYAHRIDQAWRVESRSLVLNPHQEYWSDGVVEAGASMRPGATLYLHDNTTNEIPDAWGHLRVVRISAQKQLLDSFEFPKSSQSLSKIESLSKFYRYRHTPMLSIQLALYLGYRQIILVGLDHDHVIRQLTDEVPRVGHAYPEVSNEQEQMPKQTYLDLASEIRATWGMYAALANLAGKSNALILNATPQSQLDVFPRLVM